ncbi:MAG: hypothetical protein P0107_02005 [Nitrosomonas sp.]|nr:hypothetical protein [Nitrosomonas sp.]
MQHYLSIMILILLLPVAHAQTEAAESFNGDQLASVSPAFEHGIAATG